MTFLLNRLQYSLLAVSFFLAAGLISYTSDASPGAHGPNGEHLTTEQSSAHLINPRFETFSDQFELVAELFHDSMVLQLHHFQDNSPVIDAEVEIETADLTATAVYDEKLQLYRITAPDLMTLLAKQQPHELVVTVIAEDKADLLVASYTPSSASISTETHHHEPIPLWFWGVLALIAAGSFVLGRISHRRAVGSAI
jgi:hypothetical protein